VEAPKALQLPGGCSRGPGPASRGRILAHRSKRAPTLAFLVGQSGIRGGWAPARPALEPRLQRGDVRGAGTVALVPPEHPCPPRRASAGTQRVFEGGGGVVAASNDDFFHFHLLWVLKQHLHSCPFSPWLLPDLCRGDFFGECL